MRLALTAKLIPALILFGCSAVHAPEPAVDAALAPVVQAAEPLAKASLPLESPTVTLKRELCRRSFDRTDTEEAQKKCALAKVREVADGTYVALLYRGPQEWAADGSSATDLGMTSDGNVDTFGVDFSSCKPFEYWLASVASGKLEKAQLLTGICNDGHGAAGIGEDSVTVTEKTLTIATNGGSNWRWGHGEVFSLPDLTLLSDSFDGYWSVSSNNQHSEWSWTERRGVSTWEAPRCSAGSADPPPVGFSYALVPAFESAPALEGDGWKNARSIEGCATTLDGKQAGEALSGVASPASAKLSLLVGNDALFVEIHDDKLVTQGKVRDELEVWHRQDPSGDWALHCLEDAAPASGTAIRMGDMSTRVIGDDSGTPLAVEQAPAKDGAPVRLRISLPPKTHAVTVLYRDSDDGKRHSLVLASSSFDKADDGTLGVLHHIDPERATCELDGDALTLRMKPHTDANEAISRN